MVRACLSTRKLDEILRVALLDLLQRNVIRIPERPPVDPPLEGQTTIEEALG
jgi:hypothetical protein